MIKAEQFYRIPLAKKREEKEESITQNEDSHF